jgi:myo-inositol-1(or 4)-monophosphatase
MTVSRKQLIEIVKEVASSHLMPHFQKVSRQYKGDGSIVTQADLDVQTALTQTLTEHAPEIAMLGEEMTASAQQAIIDAGHAFWCLDPIDGTSNFASGLPCFCISLALIQGQQVTLGIVYDPVREECFSAERGQGAWLNEAPLLLPDLSLTLKQCLALIDYKRLPSHIAKNLIDDKPFGSHRSLGSVALELCWLAAGRAQLYFHAKQHLWDYAAAELILREAGGTSQGLDKLPDIHLGNYASVAATTAPLFEDWYSYLKQQW